MQNIFHLIGLHVIAKCFSNLLTRIVYEVIEDKYIMKICKRMVHPPSGHDTNLNEVVLIVLGNNWPTISGEKLHAKNDITCLIEFKLRTMLSDSNTP